MHLERQTGFTLIETILVMAMGSALAMIALAGFSTLRGQTQFSDAVERLKEKTSSVRQEALSTIKTTGSGNNSCRVTIGKVMTFAVNSSSVHIDTLTADNNPLPSTCSVQPIAVSDTTITAIAWGVTYLSSSKGNGGIQVAFVRLPIDGSLVTAVSPNGGWTLPYTLADFAPNGVTTSLQLRDPSARAASLVINPSNNGVTRTFP